MGDYFSDSCAISPAAFLLNSLDTVLQIEGATDERGCDREI